MTLTLVTKTCASCGATKPLGDFYRRSSSRDGRQASCKSCTLERVVAARNEKRAEMGEEAWLAHQREITRRSRQRRGYSRERVYGRAQRDARAQLIVRHRKEYEALLSRLLDQYEREQVDVVNQLPAQASVTSAAPEAPSPTRRGDEVAAFAPRHDAGVTDGSAGSTRAGSRGSEPARTSVEIPDAPATTRRNNTRRRSASRAASTGA